tara:strand:- start:232 stop:516 length:285 start_codon:yes stop_codon:yes gene_type:complete
MKLDIGITKRDVGRFEMNERIKELESQCWEPRQYGPAWFNSTKFAELIVAECVSILRKPEYPMTHPEELTDYNRGWVNGRLLGIEHIAYRFGVE